MALTLVKLTLPKHVEGGKPIHINPALVVTVRQIVVDPDPANATAKKLTLTALVMATGFEICVTEAVSEVLKTLAA